MPILPVNSDYSSKDFDALLARLKSVIKSQFPNWTDFKVTNFGNILVEMFCFVGDVLTFQQDANARESRFSTATLRRNILAAAKLLNYSPALASAATTLETFVATGLTANVILPAGTIVETQDANDPIPFQLLSPVTLTPGSPSGQGNVENSATETQVYDASGATNQKVALSESPFLEVDSIIGSSSGGWTQVDNFLLSGSADKVFTVDVDNNQIATVTFGDGIGGLVPSDVLTITYKTGGGAAGNVSASSLTKLASSVLDVLGNPVTITVTNLEAATGGADPESVASIKQRAPVSIHNPSSTIARPDYEDNARALVPGILRALMLTADENPIVGTNAGRLYLVPTGVGQITATLLQQVRAIFLSGPQGPRPPRPAPATFSLLTFGATYLDFSIFVKVYLTRTAAATADTKTATKNAITAALKNYFSATLLVDTIQPDGTTLLAGSLNPAIDFGFYLRQRSANPNALKGQIPLSDLQRTIENVDGVRAISAIDADFTVSTSAVDQALVTTSITTNVHADSDLNDEWFPRFAAVTAIDGDTGLTL